MSRVDIGSEQSRDTGLALVLVLLLVFYYSKYIEAVYAATFFLVVAMIYPMIFYPLAIVWFKISHWMGTVMSKVILTIIFFIMVTPFSIIRKMIGADSMMVKQWKKGNSSVLKNRDKVFERKDLEKPY